jgi:F-type H+-transporting ATPase subunit epsilon
MLKFELVSPERMLASMEAGSVTIPGQMGEMTAMPGHAPFLTTLRPGYVTVTGAEEGRFFVTGGFAEISEEAVAVLAEEAVEADEVTEGWLSDRIAEAERALEDAGEERAQAALQRLNDYRALAGQA